ncbi:MAG: S8 family peptidase [Lachnospiraceae bacterium]|nr:S8 family peptidase [Lachnospiraceae bacterium]
MRKIKKLAAYTMAFVMAATTISIPAGTVKAGEVTQEYVILAKNDKGYDKAEDVCGDAIVETADELEDNNILVAEMTEKEAEKLEKDKNIVLVEEDIPFEASTIDDITVDLSGEQETEEVEVQKQTESVSEDITESQSVEEATEEVLIEKVTEEPTTATKKDTKKNQKKDKKKDKKSSSAQNSKDLKMSLKEQRKTNSTNIDVRDQWNIDAVSANEQEYKQAGDQIRVAVMDTGVSASEDINVAGRVNFIEGEEDVNPLYEDVSGHGTSVASVIAAKDNNIGVTGINPYVQLYSVKVLDDNRKTSLSSVIKGIYWCIENDIDIINMSFGTNVKSEILEQVIKDAEEKGILLIAAAGNQGQDAESNIEYPAAFEEVIAVGAINPAGTTSEISSVGSELELMAPGEDIPATGYFDEIIETDGTSMAAPHVAGVASVLWAKDRSRSNTFIRALLNASAKPMDKNGGNGVVDLNYALSVYDDFAASYVEDMKNPEEIVSDNPGKIEAYDDEEVHASWGSTNHQNAVGLYDETSQYELNVIKIGAKIPDTASYLKYSHGKTDSFHGHYNYIANYMYVMRMARICQKKGMTEALKTAKYPCKGDGEAQIYNGIKELNKHWDTVLKGYTVNNLNKARVLVGIATHIGMDTYAHKAYVKDSYGCWTEHISGSSKQDSTSYVSNRWTCAKGIAYDIVDVWHENIEPDGWEFYQLDHDKNKFRLFKLKTYCESADKNSYNIDTTWYDNRTAEKYVAEIEY